MKKEEGRRIAPLHRGTGEETRLPVALQDKDVWDLVQERERERNKGDSGVNRGFETKGNRLLGNRTRLVVRPRASTPGSRELPIQP